MSLRVLGEQFGGDVYLHHAVNELVNDGEPGAPMRVSKEDIHPSRVRFQRYPESDARVQSAMQGYRDGADVPPVLLARRGGETLTADGHHRLTAAELLKRPVSALVHEGDRPDRYTGRAKIGTLRKPRSSR